MIWKALSSLLLLAALSSQAPTSQPVTNASIHWFPCKQNASWPVTCGNLAVPWDYTNLQSGKTLQLDLLKVNATKHPVKGSILINPGGPGEVSREFLGGYAAEMLVATGGNFNIIAFDTRGTGQTIPFSCYDSDTTRAIEQLMIPQTANSSDTAMGTIWAGATSVDEMCAEKLPEIGQIMSTAFIARDMMQIVDALGEDGMLRYYGFSYGTALGAAVSTMFPERIARVVIDGTLNMPEYFAGWDVEQYSQADRALMGFCKSCVAAPETCALANAGVTAESLFSQILDLIESVKFDPIALGPDLSTDFATYDKVKTTISNTLRNPIGETWPIGANYLNALFTRNETILHEINTLLQAPAKTIYPNLGPEALLGIRCSDVSLRASNLTDLDPLIQAQQAADGWYWDYAITLPISYAQWKIKPKERFNADFGASGVQTKNPILIIGSPLDHVTAFSSAKNTSALFPGSGLIQHNGYGHCSIAQPSRCTIRATQAYFENGTLPSAGTVCEPDFAPFTNHTVIESYKMASNCALAEC